VSEGGEASSSGERGLNPRSADSGPMAMWSIAIAAAGVVVQPKAPVIVVGNGAVQILSAKLAAIRGYETTLAVAPQFIQQCNEFLWDATYPEGSLPLQILPIAGDATDSAALETAAAAAEGLIIAFDSEKQFMPDSALNVFLREGTNVKRVSMMSRYLNGAGMGFFAKAAKVGANAEVWAGDADLVSQYKAMEKSVCSRASALGASATVIRAGTLKGGASGDAVSGGSGEAMFLNPSFYRYGQQDVVNWRLLYDCGVLSVELSKGDTLPGPGFTAALTATSPDGGEGDSHRGAVAMSLVEALRSEAAADSDFSVASVAGREFPTEAEWAALFANA